MKTLKLFALLLALAPTQSLANGLLSTGDLKFLIKTCFATFDSPADQPFQVDRGRFAKMGFTILKNTSGDFEAQRIVSESIVRFKKERFGPMIEVTRNQRKPNDLKFKDCIISGGTVFEKPATKLSSRKVQGMLEAEAKRLGFRPARNAKGRTVWIKGDVAVYLNLTYKLPSGGSADGSHPPAFIYVDGVHPRDLRGIK